MTPDQLNEIERRTNNPGYQASTMHADTIALLARVRELESYLDVQHAEELQRQYVVERDLARKAEARVKELESDSWWAEAQLQTARVAVLREAIQPYAEATGSYCWGEDDCAFLKEALVTLDPAATALTERLKAAEAVCRWFDISLRRDEDGDIMGYGNAHQDALCALAAWRKLKGNHG